MDSLVLARNGFATLKVSPAAQETALAVLASWLDDPRLEPYRPYIDHLVANERWSALLDSFWRMIPFGTGGRRGPVGAGPNRINPHTIGLSVQGHCQYLREVVGLTGDVCVVIAYDVRCFHDLRGVYPGVRGLLDGLTSRDLARMAAETYAANGVVSYVVGPLADEPGHPVCSDRYFSTPELSYLIRRLGAAGGLNVSASHNHPDDNGGKFYNRFGGQEIPPDDEKLLLVVEQVSDVRCLPYQEARARDLIRFVPTELHQDYIAMNLALCPSPSRSACVAFTPLNGTGNTTVRESLTALGFPLHLVPEQTPFDGSFSQVRFRIANPEVPESVDLLEREALRHDCDLAFATDPDADRLGLLGRDGRGGFHFFNGNEIGVLLIESLLSRHRRSGGPHRPIFINTLVTSSLQRLIARRYGAQVVGDLMVGFKYMADALACLEHHGRFPATDLPDRDTIHGRLDDFLFTCEESHGYLLTHEVRDKDANGAAVHLAALASELKDDGRTLLDLLRDIYRCYGYHRSTVRSLVMEGIVGTDRIRAIQERLRQLPPREIAGLPVTRFVDYHVVGGPLLSGTDEASRNVLLFELAGSDDRTFRLVIRPSGTEPKTKIYVEVPCPAPFPQTLSEVDPADLARIDDPTLDRLIQSTDAEATRLGDAFIRYCLGPAVLGDVYGEIPDEALLVSDLVPVDHKVRLVNQVLPELISRIVAGADDPSLIAFLDETLRPCGEQPRGLVGLAARTFLSRRSREGGLPPALQTRALDLFP